MTSTCVLRGKRGAWRRLPLFHVAGVALGDIYLCFVWQAWHLVTSTCVLRGRRGIYDTGLVLCVLRFLVTLKTWQCL